MDLSGAHRNNRGRNQSDPLYERLPTQSQEKKEIKNQCEGSSGTTLSTEEVIMQPTPRKVRILFPSTAVQIQFGMCRQRDLDSF